MEGQYYQTLLDPRYIPELPSKPFGDDVSVVRSSHSRDPGKADQMAVLDASSG
jgi:hypothetical protein